jgi:hypothetical protein
MKQAFLKFTGKKLVTAAFLSATLALSSFAGNATVTKSNIEILSGENTNVQFSGSTNDALLFKVHVKNDKSDVFTLTIKNGAGDVLFSRSFNDADFQKQFKLLKGDQTNERYTFTITSTNKNIEDTYVISSVARTVEDVAVNKL